MKKKYIRTYYLQKRLNLTPAEYNLLNNQIKEQVASLDWSAYKTIHLFLPIKKFNEVNTLLIADYLKHNYPAVAIVVPKSNFKTTSMEHIAFEPHQSVLATNAYGIPEPIAGTAVPESKIDAVFVPLLAFDKKGKRVGYGKGFYDRFLAQCRPDVRKIGLSFFDPITEIEDADIHDIGLDQCICPNKVWTF